MGQFPFMLPFSDVFSLARTQHFNEFFRLCHALSLPSCRMMLMRTSPHRQNNNRRSASPGSPTLVSTSRSWALAPSNRRTNVRQGHLGAVSAIPSPPCTPCPRGREQREVPRGQLPGGTAAGSLPQHRGVGGGRDAVPPPGLCSSAERCPAPSPGEQHRTAPFPNLPRTRGGHLHQFLGSFGPPGDTFLRLPARPLPTGDEGKGELRQQTILDLN